MFNLIQSYLCRSLAIGSIISVLCLWVMQGTNETLIQVMAWLIASAGYGFVSLIYEIDRLGLLNASIIHCLLCALITLVTAFLLGYSTDIIILVKSVLPIFFVIYTIIYTAIFFCSSCYVKKINKKLKIKSFFRD